MGLNPENTAVYMRVSTHMQAEKHSVSMQRHAIDLWLKGEGVEAGIEGIPAERVYADEGATGRNMERPAWQAMHQEIVAGNIKTVVAYDLSRLGRSTVGVLQWVEYCVSQDVRVALVKDRIDVDTAVGRLMLSMLSAIKQFEAELSAERASDAIQARLAKGYRWGPEPKVAWAKVMAMRASGMSFRDIGKKLGVSRMAAFRAYERGRKIRAATESAEEHLRHDWT